MRDPTRGGVATSLNELTRDCSSGIVLSEEKIPMRDAVRGACELLGLDPLHIANEGQFLAIVSAELADTALQALHATPGGEEAVLIGEVRSQPECAVLVTTLYGGSRIVDMLVGDPLPEDLLRRNMATSLELITQVEQRLLARNEILESYFAMEAARTR